MKLRDVIPYKKLSGAVNFVRAYSSSIQHNGIAFTRGSENDAASFSSCYHPVNYLRHCFFRSYSSEVSASRQLNLVKQLREIASVKEVKSTFAFNMDTGKRKWMEKSPTKSVSTLLIPRRLFSSSTENDTDTETVKEVYDKMLKSVVEKKTAPPNAWLWSLVAKGSTLEDIKLLFDMLQKLRIFRLANLRIHENFNTALCREVTKACVRTGAIDFGMKALWKHNSFGLTPDVGSAHHLLLHAKQHNDVNLLVEVMKLVKKNDLPLQPGTADIVFSICYSADRWDLISKYGKRFVKSGVILRQGAFDLWMELAARRGDAESLWKIEKWRSEAKKKHSLSTGFACAKGFLLEHKPESAASIIQGLSQTLSEARRPSIEPELQKLASEWPSEVIKHKKEENREDFAANLQSSITTLMNALKTLGMDAKITV